MDECPDIALNLLPYFAPQRNAPKPPIDSPEINSGDVFLAPIIVSMTALGTSSAIHFSKSNPSCGRYAEPSPHNPSDGMASIIGGNCFSFISLSTVKCTPALMGQFQA